MTSLKKFYRTIVSSLSKPSSYGSRDETFGKGYLYLYLLCVVSSFVIFLPIVAGLFSVLPKVDGFLTATKTALAEVYPPELNLTFASGAMTTNVKTPYYIDVPPSLLTYFEFDADSTVRLLAIDPESSVEDFPKHQSFMLLTEKYLVAMDKDRTNSDDPADNPFENYRVMKYPESGEAFTVTREKYDLVVAAVEPNFIFVKPLIVVLIFSVLFIVPFVIAFFWLTGLMLWFIFTSLIVRVVSYFMGRSVTYTTIYVYSFYAATGVVLYAVLDALLPISIPFVGTIILLTTLILVLKGLPKKNS